MHIVKRVSSWAVYGSAAIMAFVFVAVTANIFLRQLGHSIYGLEEIIGYIMPWVIFCSVPYGIHTGRQIDVDILTRRFPLGLQKRVAMAMYAVATVAFALAALAGLSLVTHSYRVHWKSCLLVMPVWPWQVCMPIGFALMALESLLFIFRIRKEDQLL